MADKNPDLLDQAAMVTQLFTEAATAEVRRQAAPETHPDFDGLHCVEEDCGVEIPGERLELQKIRCIECQALLDAARRPFAKRI